ncbi:MAG: hypothetical protein LBE79_00425, partial [Tannerella sp.]|nr:hypothetical protein [Tannerella sp.]
MTLKKITEIIEDAAIHGLFTFNKERQIQYSTSIEFLLFIIPSFQFPLSLYVKDEISSVFSDYSNSPLEMFRNCIYTLVHQPEKYEAAEKRFILYSHGSLYEYYELLFNDEHYEKFLSKISSDIIKDVSFHMIKSAINKLNSLSSIGLQIQKIEKQSNCPDLKERCNLNYNFLFFRGKIDEAIKLLDFETEINSIQLLIEGDVKESVSSFGRLLKEQAKYSIKTPLPQNTYHAYFYLVGLLASDASISTPVFLKIMQQSLKDTAQYYYYLYAAIAYDALNEQKEKLADLKTIIKGKILNPNIRAESLTNILIYYLVGEKIEDTFSSHIYHIIKKAVDADYLILGYEAAYVAKMWYEDKQFEDLFADVFRKMSYLPVTTRVQRDEEWEKSLNLLLGLKSKTTNKNKDNGENTTRVVYYFNPKNYYIQPVVQSRNAKGWSKGRNIAMKTFAKLEVKGLTEQDIRISKHVKYYDSYYNSYYDFDRKVFADMIGHPYIFLQNADDVPVEFVAAQVVVSVDKVSKGYKLVTNPKIANQNLIIEKETNTRYKIFNLTPNQIRIIDIINQKELFVPESGKLKLTELLGSLSAEGMAVHSDLAASDKLTHIELKEMPADSRIRVQLLPYGDGLKTELFSKPFGERPPYCKPGKGGKMLIANEKDVQLQVKRNLKQEIENEQALLNDIQSLESLNVNNDLMSFDDPMDSLSLLDILAKQQDICVVEWPEGEKYKLRGNATISNLNVKITSGLNWFDLQGELRVDENTVLSLQQLLRLTAKSHNNF